MKEYAIGYLQKPHGGRAGFEAVFTRTDERIVVRRNLGDFKGHTRIVWRDENNEPYVKFDGKLHHVEHRLSYLKGYKLWVVDGQKDPVTIEVTWQR